MQRVARYMTCLGLAVAAACVFAPTANAQERGEEVVGTIARVDGQTLIVQRKGGGDVRVQLTPNTDVTFTDSGDRKLFPNPTSADLRSGMGVRFTYGSGTLDRIAVHYVPAGGRAATSPESSGRSEQRGGALGQQKVKARIESVRRDGREITADVAGRPQTFRVETRDSGSFRRGDLVVLHLEDRGGDRVVTRIDSAEMVGTVTRVDARRRSVSIEVRGREETYEMEDRDLMDRVREGDRVRFEVEERQSGARVITAVSPDRGYRN